MIFMVLCCVVVVAAVVICGLYCFFSLVPHSLYLKRQRENGAQATRTRQTKQTCKQAKNKQGNKKRVNLLQVCISLRVVRTNLSAVKMMVLFSSTRKL